MATREDQGGIVIERSFRIRGIGTATWFVLVSCVVLSVNPALGQFSFEAGYTGGAPLFQILLERWNNLPFVRLKYHDGNMFYDLDYAIKLSLVGLRCVPLGEFFNPVVNDSLEDKKVTEINVRVSLDYSTVDFWTPTQDGEILYSLPIEHASLENLSILLAELLRRSAYSSDSGLEPSETVESSGTDASEIMNGTVDTVFVGKDGQPKIIRSYGLPFLISDTLDYVDGLMTYSEEVYEPNVKNTLDSLREKAYTFPIFATSTRQLYVDKVTEGTKVVWQNLRVLTIWDDIVLFADGSITDTSLSWRMKVSQTPVDFLVHDGVLVVVDVAGNLYAVDLKNRRLMYNERVSDFKRLRVTDWGISVETGRETLLFDKFFKDKAVLSTMDTTEPSSYISHFPVYPTTMGVVKTKYGYFLRDIFFGTEIFLFYVKSNKIFVLTDVGTWIYELKNR